MFRLLAVSFLLLALGVLPLAPVYAQGSQGNPLNLTETDKILLNLSTLERSINEQNVDWFLAHFSPSYYDTNKIRFSQLKTIIQDFLVKISPDENFPLFYIDNPKVAFYGPIAGVSLKYLISVKQVGKSKFLSLKLDDRIIFKKERSRWRIVSTGNLGRILEELVSSPFPPKPVTKPQKKQNAYKE